MSQTDQPKPEIPAALENLRPYLEKETLPWVEVSIGDRIHLTTMDAKNDALGEVEFTVLDNQASDDQHRVLLRLESGNIAFGDSKSPRQPIEIPVGSIMTGGVSCEHFPTTTHFMVYVGGISTGRDFDFEHVITPNGEVISEAAIRGVTKVGYAPGSDSNFSMEVEAYRARIAEEERSTENEREEYERKLLEELNGLLKEHADKEAADQIRAIYNNFSTIGKYRLAALFGLAVEQDKVNRYLPALSKTMDEEFGWTPPGLRGEPSIPASERGWLMLVKEIGLERPKG